MARNDDTSRLLQFSESTDHILPDPYPKQGTIVGLNCAIASNDLHYSSNAFVLLELIRTLVLVVDRILVGVGRTMVEVDNQVEVVRIEVGHTMVEVDTQVEVDRIQVEVDHIQVKVGRTEVIHKEEVVDHNRAGRKQGVAHSLEATHKVVAIHNQEAIHMVEVIAHMQVVIHMLVAIDHMQVGIHMLVSIAHRLEVIHKLVAIAHMQVVIHMLVVVHIQVVLRVVGKHSL